MAKGTDGRIILGLALLALALLTRKKPRSPGLLVSAAIGSVEVSLAAAINKARGTNLKVTVTWKAETKRDDAAIDWTYRVWASPGKVAAVNNVEYFFPIGVARTSVPSARGSLTKSTDVTGQGDKSTVFTFAIANDWALETIDVIAAVTAEGSPGPDVSQIWPFDSLWKSAGSLLLEDAVTITVAAASVAATISEVKVEQARWRVLGPAGRGMRVRVPGRWNRRWVRR